MSSRMCRKGKKHSVTRCDGGKKKPPVSIREGEGEGGISCSSGRKKGEEKKNLLPVEERGLLPSAKGGIYISIAKEKKKTRAVLSFIRVGKKGEGISMGHPSRGKGEKLEGKRLTITGTEMKSSLKENIFH